MDSKKLEQRIINGAKYFKNLTPGDLIMKNVAVVKPTEWRALQKYMDLILEYFSPEDDKDIFDQAEEILK